MALLPHIALPAQTVPKPLDVLDTHIAEEPHSAEEPDIAELGARNCDEPHTVPLPHIAELFQTAEGSVFMKVAWVFGS